MRFLAMTAGTFCAAALSISLQRQIGAPDWASFGIAAVLAVLLNVAFNLSKRHYQGELRDFYWLQQLSGRVVPKWVDLIQLSAVCCALAIPFQFVAWLAR
jgi:hypothetical protein